MTWFGFVFVLYTALGAVLAIGTIGQERKPAEAGHVVMIVVIAALLIWGAATIGTN